MKNRAALAVLAVLAVVLAIGAERVPSNTEPTNTDRYQLVSSGNPNEGPYGGLFLLDTHQGRIWRYYPATQDTNAKVFVPEAFQPIGIGRIDIKSPDYGLRDSAEGGK
jgi:hypothetical protein